MLIINNHTLYKLINQNNTYLYKILFHNTKNIKIIKIKILLFLKNTYK